MKLNRILGTTALVGVLSLLPVAAFAQVGADPTASQAIPVAQANDQAQADTPTDIVVTGSRIRRPDLESTVPVATLRSEDIYNKADVNVGETLNDLPQLRSTFSQQNPGLGIGIAGLNLLDLRGLGVQRTLVLVNGRRHVPSDLQNSAAAVDINTIPTDLIEAVDIVTGGNSAVYGSDAIAGVVNFRLKDSFEGLQIRAGDSIPEFGAGGNQYISAIAGKNFAEGRGNVAVAVEYTHQDRLYGSDIPFFRRVDGFVTTDTDGNLPNGSDGIPDRSFVQDIRTSTIARFGLVPVVQIGNAAAPCGIGIPSGSGATTNYNCNYIFDSTGNLSLQSGTRVSTGTFGSFIGGNGDTGREDKQLSVLPLNDRITANLIGHYDFSDAATFFVEAKYARVHTIGSNSGPAFNQGYGQTFADERSNYRLDNPFLNAAARTTLTNAISASGNNTSLTGNLGPLSAADRAAIADGSYRFTVARNFTDLGLRDEDALRETFRVVAGLRGNVTPHVSYELSGNYGRTNENITILGNVNTQRLLLAQDAGIDPNNPGAGIQCRSKFDPAARNVVADLTQDGGGVSAATEAAARARLASDIAACVPYNAFGGADNSAARNYIVSDSGDHGHLEQIDVTGFVSADTGGFFNLPGGAIGLVLGGEYRRENAKFEADADVQSGLTFLNSLQTFDPPTLEVAEGFGELNVPILKDIPFFQSLSLSGAARVSHYNSAYGSTGTVWAYNFGGEWAPIRDIRFRANYGKAIRAPNYTETAKPLSQDFASFQDPCNSSRINAGTANRETNCRAGLGAAIDNIAFQNQTNGTYSLEILSGSNPNLTAETSRSLTVGAVIQPRFLPGFDITIDYFDINVKSVITTATAQQIVNLCYDEGQFCDQFQRNLTGATLPTGEVPGQIISQSLIAAGLNFAALKRRGIDVQANYNHSLGSDSRLSMRAYYTHQLKNSDYTDPTRPDFETRNLGLLGDPKDEVVFNVDFTKGRYTLGYGAHYIGPMLTTATYADLFSINGRPPQNTDGYPINYYPEVLYHNIRFSTKLGSTTDTHRGFEWFFGIDNLTNLKPPLGTSGTGEGSAIYEVRGRSYFSGIRATF